jgi:hypothetical protein
MYQLQAGENQGQLLDGVKSTVHSDANVVQREQAGL